MACTLNFLAALCMYLNFLQVLGGHPDQLTHMLEGIGPAKCLWVFVVGINGKIFGPFRPTAAPRSNIVPEGVLLHFTAQARFLPPLPDGGEWC